MAEEPLQQDVDPWADTTAHRGEEREDPFDDGSVGGPFGTNAELIGIPRRSAGTRSPRPLLGSTTTTRVLIGLLFLALFVVPLAVNVLL